MSTFLSGQLDFILFFYGLAFVILGTTCLAIARIGGRTEAWNILAHFGYLHGASEWLDLSALVVGDNLKFALLRVLLMTASFVVLTEFARREARRLGFRVPGPWIYVPLLSTIVVGGAIGGLNLAAVLARYIFGFCGAMAVSLIFARFSREFSGFTKRLALCVAAGFAAYAIAAGLIAPTSALWPSTIINQEWFARNAGFPIQLARGLLACWLAFSIWSIWGEQLIKEVSSPRYTRFLRRQFITTLAAMVTILIAGWMLTEFLGDLYQQNVQQEASGDIDLLASRFAGETAIVEGMVRSLAGSPSLLPLLGNGSKDEIAIGKSVLALDVDASGAMAGFVLDRSGTIVASFDRGTAEGIPGVRADEPCLGSGGGSEPGYRFALDAQDGETYYCAGYPIRLAAGTFVGSVVLKKSLADFAADLLRFDHPYFLVDQDGVVALTNRPAMMLQPLWPMSVKRHDSFVPHGRPADPAAIERPMIDKPVVDATWIKFGGERDFARRRYVGHTDWSLVMLKPTRDIYASRVLGIIVTLLVAIMTLIYLFGKERWFHDNVQMERRLKLQALARDLRFQATTDALTGLFNRLKFNETLVSEMSRAARYGTPLALVLYDVDRFKAVNDTYGHQVGDRVLTHLSRLVADNIRECDVLARWGGEEFAVMLPGCDLEMALAAAEKLRAAIEGTTIEGCGPVTCSFGVAHHFAGDTAETFLARADNALYRAKVNGRNRVEFATVEPGASSKISSAA